MKQSIKNIAIFTNTLEKGGAETQAVELSKILCEKYKVWLIIFYGNQINDDLLSRINGYDVTVVRLSGGKLKSFKELYSVVKKMKIDCIFSFLATTNIYSGIVGNLLGVYMIGGIRSSSYSGIKFYVQRFFHNNFFTKTVSNNYKAVEVLVKRGFRPDKFKVIHNMFYKPSVISEKSSDVITIISVGRFVVAKDYRTSLASIAKLKTDNHELKFRYLIIGYGELEAEIREMVDEMSLNDIVEIKINPDNILEYLVNSDIYLSTSLFEGTSNSILEAMYAKLPIVATNVGDNSYMISKENGFLTDIRDVKTISDKLTLLLNDREKRIQMGIASRNIVEEKFSREIFAKKNFDLLNELTNAKD